MKILVDSTVPSLEVAGSEPNGRVFEYDIVSQGQVVGSLRRFNSADTWSVDTQPDYTFSIGFFGRLIQVMLEFQGPA